MTKRLIIVAWMLLGLILVACQSADSPGQTEEEAESSNVAAETTDDVADTEQEQDQAAAGDLDADEVVVAPPEVIEVELEPMETDATPSELDAAKLAYAPATTPQEVIEVRSFDWVKGAEEGVITIIEYGDFQ